MVVNPLILHFTSLVIFLFYHNSFGETLIPSIIALFWGGRETSSFPHSTERKWPLGTNYQPRIEIWFHPKSEMLFESIRNWRIWIALEFLSFIELKISKIKPEMAELTLFFFYPRSWTWQSNSYRKVIDLEKEPLPWDDNPFNNWFFGGGGMGKANFFYCTTYSSLCQRKMAPWYQLSTKEKKMELQSISRRVKCSNRCVYAIFEFLSKF